MGYAYLVQQPLLPPPERVPSVCFQFLCVLFNYSPAERVVYIGNVWWIINLFSEL